MYKNLRQPIYIQAAVAAAMLFFGVTVPSNILTSGILVVFAGFLLKDAYEMVGSEYVISEESLQLQVHGKVKWEIKWRELDMVTRTKKNPRWVVVSDGKEFRMIKHSTTNFEMLVKEVIRYGSVNKDMKVHETINQYLDVALKLDDIGRIKKKSRLLLRNEISEIASDDELEEAPEEAQEDNSEETDK